MFADKLSRVRNCCPSLSRALRNGMVTLMAVGIIIVGPGVQMSRAGLVSTESVLESAPTDSTRGRLLALVEREEVAAELARQGIAPQHARKAIEALSERELALVENRMADLPAAGSGVGAVVGAAVVIFLVLLFTDIMGFTSVFPWVNR